MKKLLSYLLLFIGSYMLLSCGATDSTTTYQISISASPLEGGTVSPSGGEYNEGETLEISATPTDGWRFVRWEGDHSGTSSMTTITADNDKDIQAIFTKREYELSVNTDGEGTVDEEIVQSKSTDYEYGTVVELTANPANGWDFVEWQGDLSNSENPQQVTVDQAKEVTAVFEQTSASLTINIEGEGSITKEPDQEEYEINSTINLSASASDGWVFVEWQGDVSDYMASQNPLELTMDQSKELTAVFDENSTLYVDVEATGENNGTSWENAYIHLQDALANAKDRDEIWIAEGTYYPDQGENQDEGDRNAYFKLVPAAKIYGGFKGTEMSLDERDTDGSSTILSGDIGLKNFDADNSYHVIGSTSDGRAAIINGFTVAHGNANGTGTDGNGAGMYGSAQEIDSVIFENNKASGNGGAIYGAGGATIKNSIFRNNSDGKDYREEGGGAIYTRGTPTIINNEFSNNSSLYGGAIRSTNNVRIIGNTFTGNSGSAIYSSGGSPYIDSNKFIGNGGTSEGAGIYLETSDGAVVINSVFRGTRMYTPSLDLGVGIYARRTDFTIINCSFSGNSTGGLGSAVFSTDGILTIYNSVFWENETKGNSTSGISGSNIYIANSLVQNGIYESMTDGGGNIDEDPLFYDDELRLSIGSPAIDSGNNEHLDLIDDNDSITDIDGNTRIQGGTVDMGAFESSNN